MDEKYKILEHRADLEMLVFGVTKQELFANAMAALAECLQPKAKKFPAQEKIRIVSDGLEPLLIDFLNEINYLSEVNKEVYNAVHFKKFKDTEIVADIRGTKVTRFGLQIKAATFHGLEIKKNEEGRWQARVLFDV